eukprot:284606-Hanusia_phi.AAC.3
MRSVQDEGGSRSSSRPAGRGGGGGGGGTAASMLAGESSVGSDSIEMTLSTIVSTCTRDSCERLLPSPLSPPPHPPPRPLTEWTGLHRMLASSSGFVSSSPGSWRMEMHTSPVR